MDIFISIATVLIAVKIYKKHKKNKKREKNLKDNDYTIRNFL